MSVGKTDESAGAMNDITYGYKHDGMYADWAERDIDTMRKNLGIDVSAEDDGNGCSKSVSIDGMYVSTATSDRELYGILVAVRSMMHIAKMKEIEERFNKR